MSTRAPANGRHLDEWADQALNVIRQLFEADEGADIDARRAEALSISEGYSRQFVVRMRNVWFVAVAQCWLGPDGLRAGDSELVVTSGNGRVVRKHPILNACLDYHIAQHRAKLAERHQLKSGRTS